MKIRFTKLSDDEHRVHVVRRDNSEDQTTLVTRSFLLHDFAHLAAEEQIGLRNGIWGLIAQGAGLDGTGIGGPEAQLAEAIAGPIQILFRDDAEVEKFERTLAYLLPDRDCTELAEKIQTRGKQLKGHWRATPFGETMEVEWQEDKSG